MLRMRSMRRSNRFARYNERERTRRRYNVRINEPRAFQNCSDLPEGALSPSPLAQEGIPQRGDQRTVLVLVPDHFMNPDLASGKQIAMRLLTEPQTHLLAETTQEVTHEDAITWGYGPWILERVHPV